jgi:hypothetical protein
MKTRTALLIFWFIGYSFSFFAQTFTKITDTANPIVSTQTDGGYSGSAWVDIDNDGNIDLYTTKNFLFRNLGGGNFERLTDFTSSSTSQLGHGTSWGDYDNDGDIDLFLSGNPSLVYLNDGTGAFKALDETPLGFSDDNRGWTGAWADYDNDSFIDLVIVHPNGFLGSPGIPSRFFKNNGDGRFSEIDTFQFTIRLAPYTVGTWSDYDKDGDMDLFIGSGPVSQSAVDYLFNNSLAQTQAAGFERITTEPIATDLQDGQVWNWIDYDNDDDLDAMLTNYGRAPNRFYKNDNGTYISLTNNLTVNGNYLGNTWGDIDNDGDLDVVLTYETGAQVFINDGNDVFTIESTFAGGGRSCSLGDYDNDGDLDMFISGTSNIKGLYENTISKGNNWVIFSLAGTISNKSAIGTKVRLKSTINGDPVWQYREISAQNNFNGHNSLRVHFGLGNASTIDSVIIIWPTEEQKILTNLTVNNFYSEEEEIPSGYLSSNFKADSIFGEGELTVQFSDLSVADPSLPAQSWEWDFNNDGTTDAKDQNPVHTYSVSGIYSVKLAVSNGAVADILVRSNYIIVNPPTGIEDKSIQTPERFTLEQNFPNPFNPSTNIKFSLPDETFVKLTVYNSIGREVRTLISKRMDAGNYQIIFDAAHLTSGIYFYRIQTEGFMLAKKMLLIR